MGSGHAIIEKLVEQHLDQAEKQDLTRFDVQIAELGLSSRKRSVGRVHRSKKRGAVVSNFQT